VPTVRGGTMRPATGRRRLTSADLLRAGEAILLALVAAARLRQREARDTLRVTQRAASAVPLELQPGPRRRERQVVAS
jgi:hypothetical protein